MAFSNTSNPTQIGYTPLGFNGITGEGGGSQVVIGRDTNVEWEAIGYGSGARPDILQRMIVNLSYQRAINEPVSDTNPLESDTKISLDVSDIILAYSGNAANFPNRLLLTFKEASVCEIVSGNAVEKRMIIIGSQTYDPPPEA